MVIRLQTSRHNYFRQFQMQLLAASVLLAGIGRSPTPALAQSQRQCQAGNASSITNQAGSIYDVTLNNIENLKVNSTSNQVVNQIVSPGSSYIGININGIQDNNGHLVSGSMIGSLGDELMLLSFTSDEATIAATAASKVWANIKDDLSVSQIEIDTKNAIAQAVPAKANIIQNLSNSSLFKKVIVRRLMAVGIEINQANTVTEQIANTQNIKGAFQTISQQLPAKAKEISQAEQQIVAELDNLRGGKTQVKTGDIAWFKFVLTNTRSQAVEIDIPDQKTFQANNIVGAGTLTSMSYQTSGANGSEAPEKKIANETNITIPANGKAVIKVGVSVGAMPKTGAAISVKWQNDCGSDRTFVQQTLIATPPQEIGLTDPFGRITSCSGGILPDYKGFSIGLYEPDPTDATGGVKGVVPLVLTELPDNPNNKILPGIKPNTENSNPFYLTTSDEGRYSFLLDRNRGQLQEGRTYILLINPPTGSIYGQRRIRIRIGSSQKQTDGKEIVNYTATSMDGLPIAIDVQQGGNLPSANAQNTELNSSFGSFIVQDKVFVENADTQGLNLAVVSLFTSVCQAKELQITKTGDRAAAEPGDTVIYRLSIRNLGTTPINQINVTDNLPLGFKFIPNTLKGELNRQQVAVTSSQDNSVVTFNVPNQTLPASQVLNIIYAAQLTPDSLRGTGVNSAIVNGRVDARSISDGPVTHLLRIRSGILSDCGTIIGRVFVDKNFDGEQQPNEPGIPNAIIFLDDGNRITTDVNGLFSVANVFNGYRTGVLDLSSIPGYTLAPNLYFRERNSQSRLVHLEPGGMVRMNFGVTPTFGEQVKP